MPNPQILTWANKLQAIAQNGLAFSKNEYDRLRFEDIRTVAHEMMAQAGGVDPLCVAEWFAPEKGYATPKVDVRGVVFRLGRLLLVKERQDGLWTVPGGWADVGDSPRHTAEKEVFEESGFRTRATKLLACLDRLCHEHPPFAYHTYKLFILCELEGGEATTSIETEEVGFFSEDEIPPLSLPRVTPRQITRLFEHLRNPSLPADFD